MNDCIPLTIAVPDDVGTVTDRVCPTPVACSKRMGCTGECARIFLEVRDADSV